MKENKYRLYAGRTQTVPQGVKYSLIPFGASYMLCFTNVVLDKPFKEVPSETKLSGQEAEWLFRCKVKINVEAIKEKADESVEALSELLSNLEKELTEEMKKNQGEGNG